jgi:hypothetical protein
VLALVDVDQCEIDTSAKWLWVTSRDARWSIEMTFDALARIQIPEINTFAKMRPLERASLVVLF